MNVKFNLSPEHLKAIGDYVAKYNIRINTLRDDLLDHLCCSVEEKMMKGKLFEDAFREALTELAPNGLAVLEMETILLLDSKNIYMKKIVFAIGLLTTASMSMGMMMKILHMPGSESLIGYGFLAFILFFISPMTYWKNRNVALTGLQKVKLLSVLLSALLMAVAVILRMIDQSPLAGMYLMAAASAFSFGFLPLLFFEMYKKANWV